MMIVLLDDEPILLREGENAVRAAVPDAELRSFSLGADLLSAIEREGLKPDVVFTDIEMPGISGLELAVRVKSLCPDTRIVFVTGYSHYAVEAFRLRAHGYVMKPLTPERVREELDALPEPPQTPPASPRPARSWRRSSSAGWSFRSSDLHPSPTPPSVSPSAPDRPPSLAPDLAFAFRFHRA